MSGSHSLTRRESRPVDQPAKPFWRSVSSIRARWAFSQRVERRGGVLLGAGPRRLEDRRRAGGRHDDDALLVAHDDVARPHVHAADPHRPAEGAQRVLGPRDGDDAAGQDREAALPRLGHVADHPVHDERRHAAPLGDGAHVAAGDRVVHVAGLDDDDVARRRPVDRRVHHEVVAGGAADGVGGAGDPGHPGPEGPDADVHHPVAGQRVGDARGRELGELGGEGHAASRGSA